MLRNHTGHRMGECHQKAKLSDAQVVEMRRLRAEHNLSYWQLAAQFGCGMSTARDIVKYYTRTTAR